MLLAFLAGALLKVYDDFVDDEPILTNPYVVACLHSAHIACMMLVLAGDFWVCIVFTLFNLLCAWSDPSRYAGPHDLSYFPLVPLLLYLGWTSRKGSLGTVDWAILSGLLGVALMEPKLFPEEMSWMKFASRLWGATSFLTAILRLPLHPSMASALAMFAGYSLASTMAQMLKLTGYIRPA